MSAEMVKTKINGKYELILPKHRADRPEWQTGWEPERIDHMVSNIRKGDVVLDIGTEEGDISALLCQAGAQLVMFEPNPRVWPNIRAIWEANKLTPPVDYFVGFAAPDTDLTPTWHDWQPEWAEDEYGWPRCAYNEIIGDHGFLHLDNEYGMVPKVSLDDFVDRKEIQPDMLTLDVEGAELQVLKGARALLAFYKPLVYVSIHPEFMHHHFAQYENDVHNFMKDIGYTSKQHLAFDHEHHWVFWHPNGRRPA